MQFAAHAAANQTAHTTMGIHFPYFLDAHLDPCSLYVLHLVPCCLMGKFASAVAAPCTAAFQSSAFACRVFPFSFCHCGDTCIVCLAIPALFLPSASVRIFTWLACPSGCCLALACLHCHRSVRVSSVPRESRGGSHALCSAAGFPRCTIPLW